MYKLVILIEPLDDASAFETGWPDFLHHSERMPDLRREATSRVDAVIFGAPPVAFMHELFFDSQASAQRAMSSQHGREAGKVLQQITQGKMTLFFADHKEDEMENIRRYQSSEAEVESVDGSG
jgi:uncharacterized protein (TIGR02118 family)